MSDYKQVPSPDGSATSVDAALQYLTFTLGDEVFAMDIRTVREIIQHTAMTLSLIHISEPTRPY